MSLIHKDSSAAYTNPTLLDTIEVDPRLDAGALVVVNPASTLRKWANTSDTIPNLARNNLKRLQPAAAEADVLNVSMQYAGVSRAGTTNGKMEATPKGGWHVILSNAVTSPYPSTVYCWWRAPVAARSQILSSVNAGHRMYVSAWIRPTRKPGGIFPPRTLVAGMIQQASATIYEAALQLDDNLPDGASLEGEFTYIDPVSGTIFVCMAVKAPTGTPANLTDSVLFNVGRGLTWTREATAVNNGVISAVSYGGSISDLTETGMSFAAQRDRELAWFKECFAPGGMFYGDTIPTDPATIP